MINLILHVILLLFNKINQNKEHNIKGGKKSFHDVQWIPSYQCDAFLGPNQLGEALLGIAGWYLIFLLHNKGCVIFPMNFLIGAYHVKLEYRIQKQIFMTSFSGPFSCSSSSPDFLSKINHYYDLYSQIIEYWLMQLIFEQHYISENPSVQLSLFN